MFPMRSFPASFVIVTPAAQRLLRPFALLNLCYAASARHAHNGCKCSWDDVDARNMRGWLAAVVGSIPDLGERKCAIGPTAAQDQEVGRPQAFRH
jgi:hypothetical protein